MQNSSISKTNDQPCINSFSAAFNLSDHAKLNIETFASLAETKSYTTVTCCVLEHILTAINLTNQEKQYYIFAYCLSLINKNIGKNRTVALPAEDWSERLGCSRSLIFTMQKNLEAKGYFIICKDFDKIGRNKRNLITPTIPAWVFKRLNRVSTNREGEHELYNSSKESRLDFLDRTKLFIKLNYQLLNLITADVNLNSLQKNIWLGFYARCYKNYMLRLREGYSDFDDSSFSFVASYQELSTLYTCSTKHISKSIRALEEFAFVRTRNFYIKKQYSDNYNTSQERCDKSLWQITLSLPDEYVLELKRLKNRSTLKLDDNEVLHNQNNSDLNRVEDYLMISGTKFNLNSEQAALLQPLIINESDKLSSSYEQYIDSVIEEISDSNDLNNNSSDNLLPTEESENTDKSNRESYGIKSDPSFADSRLLLNKSLIIKKEEMKSNLGAKQRVIFDSFLKRFKSIGNDGEYKRRIDVRKEFNVVLELIRLSLSCLSKDKADKARKFACSIASKGLAIGYAAGLSKNELTKQIIYHAVSWKPTKLGTLSKDKQIDTALAVAWRAITEGTWTQPFTLAKAEVLKQEFDCYRRKYRETGIIAAEVKALESDVNKLLGGFYDLNAKIKEGITIEKKLEQEPLGQEIAYTNPSKIAYSDNNDKVYQVDLPELEIEPSEGTNVDLSHISEQEKYFTLMPSDNNDSMKLETISGSLYCVKLKEIGMNDNGELVMKLKPIKPNIFIELHGSTKLQAFTNNSNIGLLNTKLFTNCSSYGAAITKLDEISQSNELACSKHYKNVTDSNQPQFVIKAKSIEPTKIFEKVRKDCKNYHGEAVYKSWHIKIGFTSLVNGVLTLNAPTNFIRDWMKDNYSLVIFQFWSHYDETIRYIEFITLKPKIDEIIKISVNS